MTSGGWPHCWVCQSNSMARESNIRRFLGNVLQAFRQAVDAVQEHNLSSRGEHPAVQRIMQDVQEFGRRQREFKNLSRQLSRQNPNWLGNYEITSSKSESRKVSNRIQEPKKLPAAVRTLLVGSYKRLLPLSCRR